MLQDFSRGEDQTGDAFARRGSESMCNRDREGCGGEDRFASFIGGKKGAGFKMQSATCTMDGLKMSKRGERTRRDGGKDDAANALIESSKQIAIDTARGDICVSLLEFWGLNSGLDGI